jgi:hypothetical protein
MARTDAIDSRAWLPLSAVSRMAELSRPAAARLMEAGRVRSRSLPGQRRPTYLRDDVMRVLQGSEADGNPAASE